MKISKENKNIDFHAGIFKGTKSACKYLCMHSQNLLCIFLEFCTSYMHSQKKIIHASIFKKEPK